MVSKLLSLILLTLLASLALASAAFTASVSPTAFSQNINFITLTVANTNASELLDVTTSAFSITGESSYLVQFPGSSITGIASSTPKTLSLAPASAIDYSKFKLGKTYSGNLNISNTNNPAESRIVSVSILNSYCKSGDVGGNLTIDSIDITNDGEGDEDTWNLLDKIKIEVNVVNNNPDDGVKISAIVKVGLYSSTGSEKLSLDTVNLGKIKGGDDDTATFTFNVPADLKDDSYFLYVKAYRESKESETCTSTASDLSDKYYKRISIERETDENKLVVFDDIQLEPLTATCGEEVKLTAKVVNIGDSDQDKVKSSVYSKDLEIDFYEVIDNMDMGDESEVDLTFKVPDSLLDKTYFIELRNKYEFNDDHPEEQDAAYDEYSDARLVSLQVKGCEAPVTQKTDITASLETSEEDIQAGNDVTIKATIKNSGTGEASYIISLTGADSFSTVKSITPSTLTLDAGESKDVLITLKLNNDASGEQVFSIKALSGSQEETQQVSLSIPESASPISGIFSNIRSNWFIWVIVLINIILIVAIIIVAIKVSRA